MHDPLFPLFVAQRPVAVLTQLTFRYGLDDGALRQVFQDHARAQWETASRPGGAAFLSGTAGSAQLAKTP